MLKIVALLLFIVSLSNVTWAAENITERGYDDVIFKENGLTSNETNYLKIPKEWAKSYGSDSKTITHLDQKLAELVRLRISQADNCNYCVILHSKQAIKLGIPAPKIFSLSTWRQSDLFTDKEKLALEFSESISSLNHDATKLLYQRLIKEGFTKPEIEELTNVTILMDIWSRIFLVQDKVSLSPNS